jgi:hypothetical protein
MFVAALEVLWRKARGDETQSNAKIGGKLACVPFILFCKISIPVIHLMPYYAKTGRSCPPIA